MDDPLLAALQAIRPDTQTLEAEWPADDRLDTLMNILGQPGQQGPPRRRLLTARRVSLAAAFAAAAAAVAVVVGVLLPAGTPAGPSAASAATLTRLAAVAVTAHGQTVGPNQYQYTSSTETQTIGTSDERGSINYAEWQSPDGDSWVSISGGPAAGCHYRPADMPPAPPGSTGRSQYQPPTASRPDFAAASQQFLDTLPTDTAALAAYLDAHVNYAGPDEQARFAAIKDILTYTIAPPALRAAAIRVLAQTPHITTQQSATDPAGRSTIRVDFHDSRAGAGYVDTLYFDGDTAQLLDETQSDNGTVFWQRVVHQQTVTAALPNQVSSCAKTSR